MENHACRWDALLPEYSLVIIGGGITGAGILREAVRLGCQSLLVEQRDFAWGTSSRSSKLVHGGLRYLKEGRLLLTRASVHEREQLLEEGPGLIDPLGFLLSIYAGDSPGRWTFAAGLTIYDLLALHWGHQYYSPEEFRLLAPHVSERDLQGGFRYGDAQTDDARLVLRILQEAEAEGGAALNYVQAENLLQDDHGRVVGARLKNTLTGDQKEVRAKVVINATGAWADRLRQEVGGAPRIRPLRGSHLLFHAWRLPVAQAVSFLHPFDRRPVFIFPWEGATLVGTTDVDYRGDLNCEPGISPGEVAYLMAAVEAEFPSLDISLEDVISTFAGIRPVIGTGQDDPSKESRDHVIWDENGLISVTGGKLTTFRLIARDTLQVARKYLPEMPNLPAGIPVLNKVDLPLPVHILMDPQHWRRLLGRYGSLAPEIVNSAAPDELSLIPGTPYLWLELRWAARHELVSHLDDLLLRRTRLGLLLPEGGQRYFPHIQALCQAELGWDEARWHAEVNAYQDLIRRCYGLPPAAEIPDWKSQLAAVHQQRQARQLSRKDQQPSKASALLALGAALTLLLIWLLRRRES